MKPLAALPVIDAPPDTVAPTLLRQQHAVRYSLVAAMVMLAFKLAVGLHTNSLGILAEAAHSGLDLVAGLLTWASVTIAARPADANHPFGHGKFENFSALLQTILLAGTAAVIAGTALHGWMAGTRSLHLDAWAFLVMAVSIGVDWSRAHVLSAVARASASDALAADALNFSTDTATSIAVLLGLVAVAASQRWSIGMLAHADAVAACIVAAVMLSLAVRLGRRTAGVLLDEVPAELTQELQRVLVGVEGVGDLERLRLRRVGSRYFVDLQLALDRATTLERARLVRDEVAARIRHQLPQADVVVETRPRLGSAVGPLEQVQAIAQRHNLNVHDLAAYQMGDRLEVEFHLELAPTLSLAAAHALVSQLEAEMRRENPSIGQILTHIEPASAAINPAKLLDQPRVMARVQSIATRSPEVLDCHDIHIRRTGGHLGMTCHCSFPDSMSVERVHELLVDLESEIKRQLPELFRVTIHPEPYSDNRR